MVLLQPHGFVNNPFLTRDDCVLALKSLLDPLAPHTSPGGALITLTSSGTHYDVRASQLETFSRPLWGITALIAGGGDLTEFKDIFERWRRGLASGTDPEGEEYWGATRGKDQRMVEMSAIGFALCFAKEELYDPLSDKEKENICTWLGGILTKPMPDTNWLWFRCFALLSLRSLHSPLFYAPRLKADLDHLDTFHLRGEDSGWSRDGPEGVRQVDYYSGSFAIQFAQLVYSKIAEKEDPERCENYRKRAKRFLLDFVHYFDAEGRCIPFGRSMIYRFAVLSTLSAFPLASLSPPAPLEWGHLKGIVLRHLRWWAGQEGIWRSDGTLGIGFGYENMYMTENYNGGGSPYWATKAFACLSVPPTHPFWTSPELPHPCTSLLLPTTVALPDPMHIIIHPPAHSPSRHTYLLSSGQSCHYPLKHAAAKYGKFSYSSAFGFSVPTGGEGLEQLSADGMLAVCDDPLEDGGNGESWRVRRKPIDAELLSFPGPDGAIPYLHSSWTPWPDVTIETYLIPPSLSTSCFHIRLHKITTGRFLRSAEAGWAIYGQSADGRAIVQTFSGETSEGGLEETGGSRAISRAGVAGVVDLLGSRGRKGKLVQGDANSNLMEARTVIPSLMGVHEAGTTCWLGTGVFGIVANEAGDSPGYEEEWRRRPEVPEFLRKLMQV